MKTDILIVGSGCAGLFCALNLPKDKKITIITKDKTENSDSYLAQGGICMLRNEEDFESYYEDTMKAGHYENDSTSVEIMIRSSQEIIKDLVKFGVDFQKNISGDLSFTKEGAHSTNRILHHKDVTGKEITTKLIKQVKKRSNIKIVEYCTMVDIVSKNNTCYGIIAKDEDEKVFEITANYTVFACGGIGGLYKYSTNFKHLTGDAIAIALQHDIEVKHLNYVQIHPTTFYTKDNNERSFLISESVRGEGAILLNAEHERFVDELLPRDKVTEKIKEQMKKDGKPYVWLSFENIPKDELENHFPNIVAFCKDKGYDVFKECIPVVPAQHYFMGGINVDYNSKTSMEQLYAIGETSCNGVHGKNRLASNSLLESLVFAKRAAHEMAEHYSKLSIPGKILVTRNKRLYNDSEKLQKNYKKMILTEMERENNIYV